MDRLSVISLQEAADLQGELQLQRGIGRAPRLAEQVVEAVEALAQRVDVDEQSRAALLWNYTVLGEAAAQLPTEFVDQHAGVQWRRPAQLRNRIVHGYWSIDLGILVQTATEQLPSFVGQLRAARAAAVDE